MQGGKRELGSSPASLERGGRTEHTAEAAGRPPSDQRVLCPSAVLGQEKE